MHDLYNYIVIYSKKLFSNNNSISFNIAQLLRLLTILFVSLCSHHILSNVLGWSIYQISTISWPYKHNSSYFNYSTKYIQSGNTTNYELTNEMVDNIKVKLLFLFVLILD